ncbi:MAG: hypothetical protein ACI8UO_001592 [Verrucomicrobiales bacterium]|jgi:hypothetical protein
MFRSIFSLILLLGLAGAAYLITHKVKNRGVREEVGKILQDMPDGFSLKWDDVKYSLYTKETSLHGVELKVKDSLYSVRMDRVVLIDLDNNFPQVVHFKGEGLRLNFLGGYPMIAEQLEALGIDDVPFDIEMSFRYKSRELLIRNLELSAPDIGKLKLALQITNFDIYRVNFAEEVVATDILQLSLDSADLEFENGGIADRYITQQARAAGLEPEAWIDDRANAFATTFGGADVGYNVALGDALRRFLSKPDRIEIGAHPSKPVSYVKTIYARPEEMLELLGITASD